MVVAGLDLAVPAVVVAGLDGAAAIVTGLVMPDSAPAAIVVTPATVAVVMAVMMAILTGVVMVVMAGRIVGPVTRLHGPGGPEPDPNRGSDPCQLCCDAESHL